MEQQIGSKLGREYVKAEYILSPCLFNLNAEYIMRNARLYESQAGKKISRRNINNRLNRTFGNGRYVRRAVELAISNLAVRLDKIDDKDLTDEILTTIEAEDIAAPELDPESTKQARRIGFAA